MKILAKMFVVIALVSTFLGTFNITQAESQMIDLGTFGGTSSVALDINDNNQVVGWSQLESGEMHAFLWENDVMTDLAPNSEEGLARAINNKGQIVGWTYSNGITRATLWDHGVEIDLGRLGGFDSHAFDINDHGQIVGNSAIQEDSYHTHAFLWDQGTMIDLGTLGGDD